MTQPAGPRQGGVAFLLSQLGAAAAAQFGERLHELELTPPQAGLLRVIVLEPGRSQRDIARQLSVVPSSLVALVDDLQERGLVERRANAADRRRHALHLTEKGESLFRELARIAHAHEQNWTTGLDDAEREQLTALLRKLASRQELTPGVHPGYQNL